MAGRVNTKFVVLLSSIIVLVVLAVAAVYVLKVMRSADELIRQGDLYASQDQPRMALENYGRAVSKRPNDVELLQKYVATLQQIDVKDNVEAQTFLAHIRNGTRQASEVDPTNEQLLEDYYELQLSLAERFGGRGTYDELHRLASIKLEQYPDNITARKYRGIAQVRRLAISMSRSEQVQAYEDLLQVFEARPEDAQVAHHMALWSLFEARRLEGAAGSAAEIQKLRDNAVELSRQTVEGDPDDLDRRLSHLQILLDPQVQKLDEARPIAEEIEARLLQDPQPDTAVLTMVEILPRLDQQVIEREGRSNTTGGLLRSQRLLEAAVEAHPRRVLFRSVLGRIYTMQGEADLAIEQFATAWDLGTSAPAIEALQAYHQRVAAGLQEMDLRLGQIDGQSPQAQEEIVAAVQQRVTEVEQMVGENGLTLLLRGKIQLVHQNFNSAMQLLDRAAEALQGDRQGLDALMLSARARRLSGERGAAAEQLEKLAERFPSPRIFLELAELRLEMKQLDEASAVIDRVLAADPGHTAANLLRARLLTARGQAEEAIAIYESLDEADRQQVLLPLAQLYAATGKEDQARAMITQRFNEAPHEMRTLGLMLRMTSDQEQRLALIQQSRQAGGDAGMLDLLQRQVESGESMTRQELVDQLVERQDDPVLRELTLSTLHRQAGETEQADAALARAADLDADHPQVIERQFEVALQREQWDEASRIAARAGSLDLDLAGGAFFRGRLAAAQEHYDEAIAEFRRGLSARPVYSEGWRRMGEVQMRAENFQAAGDAYERAVDQRPDNVTAIRGLAAIADTRGDHAEALRLIKQALRHDTSNSDLLNTYLAYEQQYGNPSEALRIRRSLAEGNPTDMANQRALALLLVRQGHEDEAIETADALLQADGESLANVQTAASVRAMTGDVDAGRQLLEQHIAALPEGQTLEARLALARYLLAANDADALAIYRQARQEEDPQSRPVTRELADLLFARGASDQAARLYAELHEQSPDDAVIGLRYAEALLRTGDTQQAQAVLDRYPDQASKQILQAALAMSREDRQAAIESLERGLQVTPDSVMVRIQLGTLLAEDPSQFSRARELLTEAMRLNPDSTEARIAMATLHQRAGEIPEAIRELRRVLRENPANTAVRLRLVELYRSRNDVGAAISLVNDIAEREPENPQWPRLLTQLASRRGDTAGAIAHARRVVELDSSPGHIAVLADLLLQADRGSEALSVLDQHPEQVNAEPALQGLRGWALAQSGQMDGARQVLVRALERTANLPQTLNVANRAARALGHEEAIGVVESLDHPQQPLWTALAAAELEIQQKQYDQASQRLQAAASQAGGTDRGVRIMLHRLHALALHQGGRAAAARSEYEQLLELEPNDVATLNNLAYLLVEDLDQPQQGLEIAQRAARLQPDNAQILDTLGWAQFKDGQTEDARSTLERSVEIQALAPNCYHLARVYAGLGVTGSARRQAEQAVSLAEQSQDAATLQQAQTLLEELGS